MKKIILFAAASFLVSAGEAAEINGVTFDDKIKIESIELVLNGVGICTVPKFGFPIKIYSGALYVSKAAKTMDEVLGSQEPKQVVIQFLLAADRDQLNEAFGDKYVVQCVADCASASKQYVQLRNVIPSMRKGDRMSFTSYKDKLVFEVIGVNAKKIEISGESLSKNSIAMFINPKAPPSQSLYDGLMNIKAK